MSSQPKAPRPPRQYRDYFRASLLTGTAIILPVLLSLFILLFAVDFLSGLLDPFVVSIEEAFGDRGGQGEAILRIVTVFLLFLLILVVGAFAQSGYGGGRLERGIDSTMSQIPAVGSVYDSLSQMSQMMLTGDSQSFREVKMVEYPREGSYSVAFVTADTPEYVAETTGEQDLVTLFMPMGPNPFMGGFIIHVEQDRVYDVDLTVEEGISSIVSFGVAMEDEDQTATQQIGPDDVGGSS
ncbi:DUF502 domain-containing protein [Halobacteriales archaeon Cl-PHB]